MIYGYQSTPFYDECMSFCYECTMWLMYAMQPFLFSQWVVSVILHYSMSYVCHSSLVSTIDVCHSALFYGLVVPFYLMSYHKCMSLCIVIWYDSWFSFCFKLKVMYVTLLYFWLMYVILWSWHNIPPLWPQHNVCNSRFLCKLSI